MIRIPYTITSLIWLVLWCWKVLVCIISLTEKSTKMSIEYLLVPSSRDNVNYFKPVLIKFFKNKNFLQDWRLFYITYKHVSPFNLRLLCHIFLEIIFEDYFQYTDLSWCVCISCWLLDPTKFCKEEKSILTVLKLLYF